MSETFEDFGLRIMDRAGRDYLMWVANGFCVVLNRGFESYADYVSGEKSLLEMMVTDLCDDFRVKMVGRKRMTDNLSSLTTKHICNYLRSCGLNNDFSSSILGLSGYDDDHRGVRNYKNENRTMKFNKMLQILRAMADESIVNPFEIGSIFFYALLVKSVNKAVRDLMNETEMDLSEILSNWEPAIIEAYAHSRFFELLADFFKGCIPVVKGGDIVVSKETFFGYVALIISSEFSVKRNPVTSRMMVINCAEDYKEFKYKAGDWFRLGVPIGYFFVQDSCEK